LAQKIPERHDNIASGLKRFGKIAEQRVQLGILFQANLQNLLECALLSRKPDFLYF